MKNIVAKALIRKNEIVLRHIDVTLIPIEQIEDIEYTNDDLIKAVDNLSSYLSLVHRVMRPPSYSVWRPMPILFYIRSKG